MSKNKNLESESKETKEKKPKNPRGIGKFTLFLILAVLLWNTAQIWMISSVVDRVDKYNEGAVIESGKMMGDVKLFAEDLNDIRRFLLLPERDYAVSDDSEDTGEQEEELGTSNSKAMYAFLDNLTKEEEIKENRVVARPVLDGLVDNAEFWNSISEAGLNRAEVGIGDEIWVVIQNKGELNEDGTRGELFGEPLFKLVFDGDLNLFKVQSAIGEQEYKDYSSEGFINEVQKYLIANAGDARKKKLGQKEQEKLDIEKAEQAAVQAELNKYKELDDLVVDEAFVDTLKSLGLSVKEGTREESNLQIYDIIDANGKVEFSVAMEISSGMIKVIKDNQEIDIKSFLTDGSKKKS